MILNQIAGGLAAGALYGLLALSIVLVFRVSGVANFAQGEFAMLSTFVTYRLVVAGVPLWASIIVGLAFAALLGLSFYYAVIRTMRNSPPMTSTIATLGAQIALSAVAVRLWAANQPYRFPAVVSRAGINIGPVTVSGLHIAILIITLVLLVVLGIFFKYTVAGLAMRTVAQNVTVARMCGIQVERVLAQTWALSSVISALAGILFAPIVFLSTSMMDPFQLRAFTAGVLGGMQSWPGVVTGGLLFGALENIASTFISTQLQPAVAYIVIVSVLLVRPAGLFGRVHRARV